MCRTPPFKGTEWGKETADKEDGRGEEAGQKVVCLDLWVWLAWGDARTYDLSRSARRSMPLACNTHSFAFHYA